jgi:hypothetical protein
MSDTEAFASHIEGLAYSQEEPVVYLEPHAQRNWLTAVTIAASVVAFAAIIANMVVVSYRDQSTQSATPPETTTVEPPSLTVQPDLKTANPAQLDPSSPSALQRDNPDTVFLASWHDRMPQFPFSDYFCVDSNKHPGCWFDLADVDSKNVEFIFLGRGRCNYINDHPGVNAKQQAAQNLRDVYSDITPEQSREIVKLAIHAYCPQYE